MYDGGTMWQLGDAPEDYDEEEWTLETAMDFLVKFGFRLHSDWTWRLPSWRSAPSRREMRAIWYLNQKYKMGLWYSSSK